MMSARVAICVCTRRRPKMLLRCLESLAEQLQSPDIDPFILVVENDDADYNRAEVAHFGASCPMPVHYFHEERIGIAFARNAACKVALNHHAQWIAFIDDDETAAPDWISELMDHRHIAILQGVQQFVYPEPLPFWALPRPLKPTYTENGFRDIPVATTSNVRFMAFVFTSGLRFDTRLGAMGGEDIDFFARARERGFFIGETDRAVTFETLHPERLTLFAQTYRAYWCAASDVRMWEASRGRWWTISRKGHTVPTQLVFGVAELLIAPLTIVAGLTMFKRWTLSAVKHLGKGAGRLAGLLHRFPKPYKNVVGE